jgi:Ribbon-helix-helix protein, copG family
VKGATDVKAKKTSRKPANTKGRRSANAGEHEKPIALTLKIDGKTYERLTTLRAKQRRTHQDILKDALRQYLEKAGA